jgi:hypothetical protein
MASRTDTARPAARKGQATKQTKTIAKKTSASSAPSSTSSTSATSSKAVAKSVSRRLEPIIQTVDRNAHRPVVDVPKMRGELPVPVATFYF